MSIEDTDIQKVRMEFLDAYPIFVLCPATSEGILSDAPDGYLWYRDPMFDALL